MRVLDEDGHEVPRGTSGAIAIHWPPYVIVVSGVDKQPPGTKQAIREIVERTWENRDGYMWGEHVVAGSGAYRGQRLKLWFKNENHMTWLDGRPYVSSPDVVEVVDPKTAEPLVNTYVEKGQGVSVIAIKRGAHFDTPAGIEAMGPRHWGFDVEFTPVERLLG